MLIQYGASLNSKDKNGNTGEFSGDFGLTFITVKLITPTSTASLRDGQPREDGQISH